MDAQAWFLFALCAALEASRWRHESTEAQPTHEQPADSSSTIPLLVQYTWDKQVETWVKKSGILGGAGKDPTVISPKQYSRRFRSA